MKVPLGSLRGSTALAAALLTALQAYAGVCGFQKAFLQSDENGSRKIQIYEGTPIPELGNKRPLLFVTSLKVNTDGTKISYHQNDVTGRLCAKNPEASSCAINNIRNAYRNSNRPESDFEAVRDAGYPLPDTWALLSPSIIEKNARTGKPCISPEGYLVSMTADVAVAGGFSRQGDCDQTKWIDALSVPALVIPGKSRFLSLGVARRSIVVALSSSSTKRVVLGVVGDIGPANELGEASVAMNRVLNGLPDTELPKHRADAIKRFQAGPTAILIFPGMTSILARPITSQTVRQGGNDALAKFGGADKLYGCIKDEIDPNF